MGLAAFGDGSFQAKSEFDTCRAISLISMFATPGRATIGGRKIVNEDLATKFERWHRHGGDEVRHILDGAGVFGVIVDGKSADLHVGPGDFVAVPAGLEHNFRLTEARQIKAVRYFSDPAGWVAEFTGRV
jgi:cupin superfamily acireductone dioxygenase involved in methionine salvage